MPRPNGADALEVRKRYLKERYMRSRGRSGMGFWLGTTTFLSWLFISGLTSIAH